MESSKVVQDGALADPSKVAKDGYDALMAGEDMVISGFKNKIQIAMSNIIPDHIVADNIKKMQRPKDKAE
jgi:short-subunit dehydrogenase